jgi:hypothetical protein
MGLASPVEVGIAASHRLGIEVVLRTGLAPAQFSVLRLWLLAVAFGWTNALVAEKILAERPG